MERIIKWLKSLIMGMGARQKILYIVCGCVLFLFAWLLPLIFTVAWVLACVVWARAASFSDYKITSEHFAFIRLYLGLPFMLAAIIYVLAFSYGHIFENCHTLKLKHWAEAGIVFWVLFPPIWFFTEYQAASRGVITNEFKVHSLEKKEKLDDFKTFADFASKIWAAFLVIYTIVISQRIDERKEKDSQVEKDVFMQQFTTFITNQQTFVSNQQAFNATLGKFIRTSKAEPKPDPALLFDKTFREFAAKYSAIVDLNIGLTNRPSTNTDPDVFTIDVQESLLHKGQPIAFRGVLEDIWEENGHIIACFVDFRHVPFFLTLRVTCSPQQRILLGHTRLDEFAIVAEVTNVMNSLDLKQGNSDDETGSAKFDIEAADTYSVFGRCIDVLELK